MSDSTYIIKLVTRLEEIGLGDVIMEFLDQEWDEASIRGTIQEFVDGELQAV
jgi:hypothetical protein